MSTSEWVLAGVVASLAAYLCFILVPVFTGRRPDARAERGFAVAGQLDDAAIVGLTLRLLVRGWYGLVADPRAGPDSSRDVVLRPARR